MKRILFITVIITIILFSGCNMMLGSGVIVDNQFLEKDFTAVEVSSACQLTITEGSGYSVVISCDDNLVQYLIVEESEGILKIGLQPFSSYNQITFKANVVMPDLRSIKAIEASDVKVSGFDNKTDLIVDFQQASFGDVELISVGDINIAASEASKITVSSSSSAGNLNLEAGEASTIILTDCPSVNAAVVVEEASKVWVNTSGTLSGRITEASSLYYRGFPDVSSLHVEFASSAIPD